MLSYFFLHNGYWLKYYVITAFSVILLSYLRWVEEEEEEEDEEDETQDICDDRLRFWGGWQGETHC